MWFFCRNLISHTEYLQALYFIVSMKHLAEALSTYTLLKLEIVDA